MEPDNQTNSSEFILLGLSEKPEQETLLFALFLCMYVVTVVGNLLIILAISRMWVREMKPENTHGPPTSRTQRRGLMILV